MSAPMFRWLGADDLAQWRDIRSEGLRLSPTAFLTTLAEFEAESDETVQSTLSQGNVLGAFDGDRVICVAAFLRMSRKTQTQHRAEIGAVYARPEARGTGVAQAMMQHFEDHARAIGVTQLELYVESRNAVAKAFYAKLGYEECGVLPNAVIIDGVGYDDLCLVRLLDR